MRLSKISLNLKEALLMSLIILIFFAIGNILLKKTGAAAALTDFRAKSEIAKNKLAESQAFLDKLSKRDPSADGVNADYLDQYLRLNDRFSSVITGIVSSSKGGGFMLTRVSLEGEITENGYKRMLYSMDAEASFISIGKFLEKLEDAPLLTEVSSVEINRIENEMKRCKAHIKLYSYVRADGKI